MATIVKKASNRVISCDIDRERQSITWTVAGGGTATLDVSKCSDDTCDYAMYHGFKQSVGDTAALGAGTSPVEKLSAIRARISTLETVGWSAEIQIVDVIATLRNVSHAAAREFWDGLDAEKQKAVRNSTAVRTEIDRRRGGDSALGDELLSRVG